MDQMHLQELLQELLLQLLIAHVADVEVYLTRLMLIKQDVELDAEEIVNKYMCFGYYNF